MDDKIYLIIEDVNSQEWGRFQVIPYWFEDKEEAEELVASLEHKSYSIKSIDRSDWENGYEEQLLD